ncbi:MAG: hypothetical protein P8106_04835, partial [Gammaproteobacteria bacterium]
MPTLAVVSPDRLHRISSIDAEARRGTVGSTLAMCYGSLVGPPRAAGSEGADPTLFETIYRRIAHGWRR